MGERPFLVFRLIGPMAAYGNIAVGERRSSWDTPSKSGILGLIGAAIGLDRADTAAHRALDRGLGFAVRSDAPGRPLRDYHAAQAPKARKGKTWRTRRDELADDDLNTVLSERIYRIEASATVVLWEKVPAAPDLSTIEAALKTPHFVLYLGRKSCPLGRPPRPMTVVADTVSDALASYDAAEAITNSDLWKYFKPTRNAANTPLWVEEDAGADPGGDVRERRQRRDGLMDRSRWQFTDRREARVDYIARLFGEGEA